MDLPKLEKLPGKNTKCPCGSGRKFRKCHRPWYTGKGSGMFALPGNPGLLFGVPTIRGTVVSQEASSLPLRLLHFARFAVQEASRPDAHEYQGVQALLMVATAGEGIVNRLLEPLMPPADWDKFEWSPAEDKWIKLSALVGITPTFSKGAKPLQAFTNVIRLRNRLAHFKHGKATSVEEVDFATSWKAGNLTADLSQPLGAPRVKPAEVKIDADIAPAKAREHYAALFDLLVPVLQRHPSDQFDVVREIRKTLGLGQSSEAAG